MKTRIVLLIFSALAVALAGCSTRRTAISAGGTSPLDTYTDTGTSIVSCFASEQPRLGLVDAGQVVEGQTVTFRVYVPGCNSQLRLVRDGESAKFSQTAFYDKTMMSVGTFRESVRVEHINPVSKGPAFATAQMDVVVIAAPAGNPQGARPYCDAEAFPAATVPLPVNSMLEPQAAASFVFVVTSPAATLVTAINALPDPTRVQLQPFATVPATAHYIPMNIANPLQNRISFRVADPANLSSTYDCSVIVTLDPVIVAPPPTISLAIGNQSSADVGVSTVEQNLTWSSTAATSCAVKKNGTTLWNATSGQQSIQATLAPAIYSVDCSGAGGSTSKSITLTLLCDPNTNVLRTQANLNTIARNPPRRSGTGGTTGSLPSGVQEPVPQDVIIKSTPLLSGLAAGQKIKFSAITGRINWRVRHSGDVEGWSACSNSAGSDTRYMHFQFTDDAGTVVTTPAANVPSGTNYPASGGGIVPVTEFTTGNGVIVPAGATKLWDSFLDFGAWWDNEFAPSDGPRNPGSLGTGGCRYTATVLGCQ